MSNDKAAGRVLLPDYVQPINYDLKLIPDLVKFSFDGIVTIDFSTSSDEITKEQSKTITLHSKEIMYREARCPGPCQADGARP